MTKPANAPANPAAAAADAPLIEIFRAGRQTDMHGRVIEFSRQDLADMAANYDPALHEAPVVIGHPKDNTPAYGWVRGLQVDGDVLSAQLHQMDADFADMVRAGRFKKRSASIFLPDGTDNPTPGKYALRHVGFLGGAAPAVKGLKEVNFVGNDEGVAEFAEPIRWWVFGYIADLFRGLREREIESNGLEKANQVFPSYQIDSIREAAREPSSMGISYAAPFAALEIHAPPTKLSPNPAAGAPAAGLGTSNDSNGDSAMTQTPADFAAREQKIVDDAAALAAREKTLVDRETKVRRDDAADFADGLVTAGKLLPKDKATVVELLLALPIAAPLSFASGDETIEKPAAELFRELLDGMPKQLNFSEKSGAEEVDAGSASFVAPAGTHVNADALELHRKALAYQAQHPGTSILAAAQAVGG